MAWQKKGKSSKYIRFQAGETIEGIVKNVEYRDSPFTEGETMVDITLELPDGEKILSSSSSNLKETFHSIATGTAVRISMISKGGKKLYDVQADE